MKKNLTKIILSVCGLLLFLDSSKSQTSNVNLDYSFVVLGCNRVETNDSVGNPSTANIYQINRVFTEVAQMSPLPKYIFFTGDIVLGYENDTVKLASQLTNWLAIYNAHPIKNTSVQLVVIPGNHETQDKANGKKSFVAAERTFVRIMQNYILGSNGPSITGLTAGTDSLTTDQSKLTYSFDYNNDHFVVINTDPVGRDGRASYKWIGSDIASARARGVRHIFGLGHKPAFTGHFKSTPDGLENFPIQRDSLWNIFENNQVDAFITAHVHVSDTVIKNAGKTTQIIAGNGGSLVETTFIDSPYAYFGYVVVNVYKNDSVNVKNMGRDNAAFPMTATNYQDPAPTKPTTVRKSYNINVNPVIDHTSYSNTSTNGPFIITAVITDNISVTSAQLNYSVNGVSQTPLTPSISGSQYTFTIPAQTGFGLINYNIQANDASLVKVYSTNSGSTYHSFNFGPYTYAQQGPSSSATPYILPVATGVVTNAVISVPDSAANGYKMAGIPDGLGAYDNGNGTFTLLMNHELTNTSGVTRAHGSIGAFVSKWVINKSNLAVLSGSDLMQNVNLYDTTTQTYTTYNASNPSTKAKFGRFCSADLPPVAAFYNANTGKGTQEKIFMNGEETNDESRAMAHIVTGTNAGTSWELPALGKAAWENGVASPSSGDKTVVALTNDGTDGQVYFYIGNKTTTGTEIDKAGLNNGTPWGVKVTGFSAERTNSTTLSTLPAAGTRFSLVDLGNVKQKSGATFNTLSNTAGVTKFSRPEDGAWDPSSPNDFYFNTTDQLDQVNDGIGTQVGRSRVWRLRFDDIKNPELGGTVEAVLDGTEGHNMLDNMTIDKYGHIILQEDVGNAAHNGKMFQYTIGTDQLKQIAKHDPARFGDIGIAATSPFNQDEETSGIIDMEDILGAGMFLSVDQAHYLISGAAVEGGQLFTLFNPDSYNSAKGQGISSSATPYILPVATGVVTN
ncbi:MAG: metallophosphoesterase, partial [Bacteroidota bacterium]